MKRAIAEEINPPANKIMNFSSPTPSANAIPKRPVQMASIATPNMMISVNRSSESPLVWPGALTMTGLTGISTSFAKIASFAIETICFGFLCGAGILLNSSFFEYNIK